MPSGRTHLICTGIEIAIGTPLVFAATNDFVLTAAFFVGAAFGMILSPDADCDSGFVGFAVIRKFLGEPVSLVWKWLLYPYARIAKHRGFLSHSPIATFIRLAYILCLVAPVFWFFNLPVPQYEAWMGYAVLGLWISDFLHISLDWLDTNWKRKPKFFKEFVGQPTLRKKDGRKRFCKPRGSKLQKTRLFKEKFGLAYCKR